LAARQSPIRHKIDCLKPSLQKPAMASDPRLPWRRGAGATRNKYCFQQYTQLSMR